MKVTTRKQHTYQLIPTQNLGSSLVKNLIAKNEYDQLGQLITKKVGGTAANASDRWQEINYNYNIRGWLTRINDIGLVMAGRGLPPPSPSDDLFSFAIQYNQLIEPGSGDYTSPLYNGNIAQTFWKTASDNTLRGYNYEYDQLNRLLNAEFYKKGTNPYSGAYNEALAYDVNGNIKNLIRTTADANNNPINMDELTYSYHSGNGNSNLLLNVSDAVSNQNTGGFKDGNTNPAFNDYEYDANGNMVKDRNKGIESITYNYLNLPTKVTWSNEKYISYQYNAAGQKISKSVRENDSIKVVEYLDGFQYAGKVLQFFPHAEGYVKVTALSAGRGLPTSDFAFNYVFNYTDHLGNVRLSYTKDPQTGTLEILDENHYYPFGLKHGVYTAATLKDFRIDEMGTNGGIGGGVGEVALINVTKTEYQYKYNGFEYQDELGLNWYDYMARNYDPAIGRWFNMDPLAEVSRRYSPYTYALDNPVYFIDPDGMMATPPDWYIDASTGKVLGQDGAATNNVRVIRGADWRGTISDFGGSTSAEATSYLQQSSSVITVNEKQIQSDVDAINNATINDQTAERQMYIGLNVDKSENIPTAELTSAQGPVGTDGEVTVSIDSRSNGSGIITSRNFTDTNLVPIAQAHTHNLTQQSGMVNTPGTSTKDVNTANSLNITSYAIDSYTGTTQGGNAIHSVTSGGVQTNNIGTTSNQNIGQDALNNLIGQ